ncbi:aldehyde dehydrogenase (NADP(+)) [Dinoroseobacter sp. S375]|uniref:aldehyde dehydrogenase (NADP(+)) n=1 Tax=Dinoroseobacter sp. S375 TaxID=3415136 RepID=UPI003C7C4608
MALTGAHFIAGKSSKTGAGYFQSKTLSGRSLSVSEGGSDEVDLALNAAEDAFIAFAATDGATRATLLRRIADKIEARADDIAEIGTEETGLPEARLRGETGRTTGQLRMFADFVEAGRELEVRHDPALPDREPLPRPDLRLKMRPVGPVVVFGASNFPLAFSVAGGDTASALAAGCPVVVKGHPAHPGTGEVVASAISESVSDCALPSGVFSMIQGTSHALGHALVTHPLTAAVGFTGSLAAGRALFDLCAARPVPIPFFGELGSINPVFILPGALAKRGEDIACDWVASLTMGVGQFCTNPGLVIVPQGADGDRFLGRATSLLKNTEPQTMLTDSIASTYRDGLATVQNQPGVQLHSHGTSTDRMVLPGLAETTSDVFIETSQLHHEVFGPFGLVVRVQDDSELMRVARHIEGQLTCTLQMDASDKALVEALLPVLERKAGRILANGFPTGVDVAGAMVHGGPYPASTNFGHSSVGTIAIRRWLRPVCYQGFQDMTD